jgi:tetratricopeptide (TPR) repeat protein
VYASLTRGRRAELHRGAADWYGERDPTLRAEHLDRAEAPEAAQAYLAAASARAAAFHYERALGLAERGAALARDAADLHALNMLCGSLRFQGGEEKAAVDAYRVALAAASSPVERCRALLGIAAGHRLTATIDPAFAALAEAEPIASAHGLTRELAELHYTRGNLYFARADAARCRTEHEAALACAQSLGDHEWEARALSGLADADYAAGRIRTALDRFARCVALCEAHGMTRVAIPNRIMMGHCRCYISEFDAGLAEIRIGLALALKVGDKHAEMFALESQGVVLTTCARYGEAEPALRRSLELAEAMGARRYQVFGLACLAECLLASGRHAEALAATERALGIARASGMAFGGPIILGLRQRMVGDPVERERGEAEASDLFASGSIAHNQIGYRRHVIEDAIARRDWPRALAHAAALEEYTRAEPLPSCDFIIARARVIAALAAQPEDPDSLRELARLKDEAARLDWPITWP